MDVYLAGKMRGLPEFNFPAFIKGADRLRARGYRVFNPADRDIEAGFDPSGMTGFEDLQKSDFSLREALAADVAFISERAEAVVLLPGWETSKGAQAEVALARALDLPVIPLSAALYDSEPLTPESMRHYDIDNSHAGLATSLVAAGEVRTVSDTGGEKGTKAQRYDLLPGEALDIIAEHYAVGAEKYAAHNWRRGYEWSKAFAAMMRHAWLFWRGEDNDKETGTPHMAAVAFHAMSLLTFGRYPERYARFDDRYKETEASE